MEEFELIAKTFQGLEEVLAKELTALGANNIEIGRRMVSFSGDKEMMYRANFALRTAIRILKPIKHFTANSADEVLMTGIFRSKRAFPIIGPPIISFSASAARPPAASKSSVNRIPVGA